MTPRGRDPACFHMECGYAARRQFVEPPPSFLSWMSLSDLIAASILWRGPSSPVLSVLTVRAPAVRD